MSSYDVHIGKLISGRRGLEGEGSYFLCIPDKEIVEVASYGPEDGKFVSSKDMENALYEFCISALDEYIGAGYNKDVYTFSIYTDTCHGSYVIYMNNLASLDQSVREAHARYQKQYLEKGYEHYNRSLEQLYVDFKYGEGDYAFMYEEMPERLKEWMNVYYCVSLEEPDYLDIKESIIFEK